MHNWRRFFPKLANLVRRRRAEEDLAREVASHLTLLEDDFQQQGLSPEEAKRAARRAYGSVEQAKELHREERSFVWLEHLWQDFRHAFRGLAKSPRFVGVAVLSLAFGIGVNTAIFTLVNDILLKKLPISDPDRIVQVNGRSERLDVSHFNFPVFRELDQQDSIFDGVAAFSSRTGVLEAGGDSRSIDYALVTGSYFLLFGGEPALGRLIEEEDDLVEGARNVCVLSYEAWRNYFGGDSAVLNQTVRVDNVPLQVIGVAGPHFVGAELQKRYDLWAPTALVNTLTTYSHPRDSPHHIWLPIMARLKSGVSFSEASARLQAASPVIEEALPEKRANAGVAYQIREAAGGFDTWRYTLRDPLLILMGAVVLVLLVACANLTNLLLARSNDRNQEFAVKLSLGISKWRLLRQQLVETLLLSLTGGAAALGVAFFLTRFLIDLFNSGSLYRTLDVAPDQAVFLFTLGVCILITLIVGLYPAWRASRTGFTLGLKGESAFGVRGSFVRRGLILVQVTLAVVLLFGASLFTHSLRNLRTIDLGYDTDQVLTVELTSRHRSRVSYEASTLALDQLLARLRELPQVESAAISSPAVMTGSMMAVPVKTTDSHGEALSIDGVYFLKAGPDYFRTLGMPLVRGRDFQAVDREGSLPVVVVNQHLASRAWPDENPVGKRIDVAGYKGVEVIGLVADSKYHDPREETKSIVYSSFHQSKTMNAAPAVQVRFLGASGQTENAVRQMADAVSSQYQVSRAVTIGELRDSLIAQERLLAFLSSLFGILGTTLSLVGIYGLISYSVARRTREVGIRMSVGAQRGQVLWLFVREAVVLLGAGVALGLPLALGLARLVESLLYEVSTSDPVDLSMTVTILILGGLLASYVPGRRATRVNPVQALRYE